MGWKEFVYVRNEEQIEVISQEEKGDKTPDNSDMGHLLSCNRCPDKGKQMVRT